jgi:hypothetical protein
MKIDTYSEEWRRLTEARWVLRECKHMGEYLKGVKEKRGDSGHKLLLDDIYRVRPHLHSMTKKVALEIIEQMKGAT